MTTPATTAHTAQRRSRVTRDAVARLVWIGLAGPSITTEEARLIDRGVGGVVLFTRNIRSAAQLRELTAELRARAPGPLRVAIDHEGGHVARMGAPLTRWPSAMALAATGSEDLAYRVALAAGRELATLGIDVNFAPVLDVALDPANPSIGVRAFSSAPDEVARFGAATIRGYRDAGIASTAKHFPGHGRTPVDSHVALPIVTGGRDALRRIDLVPFRAAIEEGADLTMISQVAYEGLTGGLPSTLSRAVIGELLRGELGFNGMAITDSMMMRAVADGHPIPEACEAAVRAGADAVMPLEAQEDTLAALEHAARTGRLETQRIVEAIARADRLDADLLQRRTRAPRAADLTSVAHDHGVLAAEAAERSLTIIRGAGRLPLPAGATVCVVEFASRRPSLVEEAVAEPDLSVAARLRRHYPAVDEFCIEPGTAGQVRGRALGSARTAHAVLIATRDAYLWPEERELVGELVGVAAISVLVALRNPYDLVALRRTDVAIAAYADVPATLRALALALAGDGRMPGRLPMKLPAVEEDR